MVAAPATRGPIPERKPDDEGDGEVTRLPGMVARKPPEDARWHPIARMMYASFEDSGVKALFQTTDWVTLYLLCENLNRLLAEQYIGMQTVGPAGKQEPYFDSKPLGSGDIAALFKVLGELGATEGARRRLRIELQNPNGIPDELPEGVRAIDSARSALGG